MNPRGLAVAAVILAILTGVLYWSQHRKLVPDTTTASSVPSAAILKVNMPDITGLTIKSKGAQPIMLKKTGDTWAITEPAAYAADQEAVAGVLAGLSFLTSDRVVEDKAGDRGQYGLDNPMMELDITQKGQPVRQLLIGDDTPAGGDAYAAVASDPKVFTIASYNKSSLNKGLNDLRSKRLFSLNPDQVSKVELLEKPQPLEFERTREGWQIVKPSAAPADSNAVNDLVRNLSGARMDLTATDAPAQFAHATPLATARLTGDSGTQTLEVRKNKADYYARTSAVGAVYKVDSSIGMAFDKKLGDFQKKSAPAAAASPTHQ